MKVIVGLGNPGERYVSTRHNIGFQVLGELARACSFSAERRHADVASSEGLVHGERVLLVRPLEFMNRSGPPLLRFLGESTPLLEARAHSKDALATDSPAAGSPAVEALGPEVRAQDALTRNLLVIHDDLDLPLGRVRFRRGGSSGGHRGIQSILEALGTEDFGRLKVGISRPPEGVDAAEYVLEPLEGDARAALAQVATRVAGLLPCWVQEGSEACANLYNGVSFRDPETPPEKS